MAADLDPEKTLARDVMTPDPVTADRDDDLGRLLGVMSEQGVRRLPLLAKGRLVGVVSLDDILVDLTSYLFNASQGILGGLHDSRRTARHRRRLEAREDALHEIRDQLAHVGSEARERLRDRLEQILERIRRSD